MTIADVGIVAIDCQPLAKVMMPNLGRIAKGLETEIVKALDAGADVNGPRALSATVARMVVTGLADGRGIGVLQAQTRDGLREIRSLHHADWGSILDFVVKSASPFPALGLLARVGLNTANQASPPGSDLWFAGVGQQTLGGLEAARGGWAVNTSAVQLVGEAGTALVRVGADEGGGRSVLLVVEFGRITVLPDGTALGLKWELWLKPLGCNEVEHARCATKHGGMPVVHLHEIRDREGPAGRSKAKAVPRGEAEAPQDEASSREAATHFSEGRSLFMSESR